MTDRTLRKAADALEGCAFDVEVHRLTGAAFLANVRRPGPRMARRPVLKAVCAAVAFEQSLGGDVTAEGLSCGLRIAGMVLRAFPWNQADIDALDSHLTTATAQG